MNKCHESFIRSVFLGKIKEAFDRNSELQSLLLDNFFSKAVQDCQVQEVSQEWPQIALFPVIVPLNTPERNQQH